MNPPAQVVIDAPASLVVEFAPKGYHVALLITRTGKLDLPDKGAFPPPIHAPIAGQELKNLHAAVTTYEAVRPGL